MKTQIEAIGTDEHDPATRLHVVDGDTVWLDTDIGVTDGLCIGVGASPDLAVADAISALEARLRDLQAWRAAHSTVGYGHGV